MDIKWVQTTAEEIAAPQRDDIPKEDEPTLQPDKGKGKSVASSSDSNTEYLQKAVEDLTNGLTYALNHIKKLESELEMVKNKLETVEGLVKGQSNHV